LGGNSNAATTDAWTSYYIDTTADRVADAVALLADWTNNALIPETEFNREHEVVTRELERGEDNVDFQIYTLAQANVYQVHPVRIPVIGYLSQLKTITRQDVLDYYHARYVPNNMIVGVVGDVDVAKVHALVQQAFSSAERKALPPIVLPAEPEQVAPRSLVSQKAGLNLTRMLVEFPTVTLEDPDMYPLDLLSFILSQGESSRLVRELRDKQKLVSRIDTSSYTPFFVRGTFAVSAIMKPGLNDAVRSAIWEQLDLVMRAPVSADELKLAKTQKIADQVFSNQDAGDQCSSMVMDYFGAGDPDFSLGYTERIQRVTADDIMRVARKYFTRDHECLTVLEPVPQVAATNQAAPVRRADAAEDKMFKLDNGMKLLVKRNRAIPAVSIQAFVLGGLRSDSIDKSGLASLTAEMIVRGTRSRSADEISRAFESMGGSIDSASGNNACYLAASVLAPHTDDAIALFADVLRNPSFPQGELDNLRRRVLLALDGQKDRLPSVASRAFRKAAFPASVYGLDPLGSPETLPRLTRDDLVAYYRAHVKPSGLVLAVYGDVDPDAVLKAVKAAFDTWKSDPLVPDRIVLDKPVDAPVFHLGYRSMPLTDVADADAMTVLLAVVGGYGYPGGWLHTELRGEAQGLVYEVHAQNGAWLDTGLIDAFAQCQPDKIQEVVRIMLDDFARARRGEVKPDELALAKARIVTTRLLGSQTAAAQAAEASVDELYGLGFRFPDSLPARINAVTLDDLARVAKKYFNNPVVVITTPSPASAGNVKALLTPKTEK
jgi:zinc protease